MKKQLMTFLLLISILLVTGCGTNNSNEVVEEKNETVEEVAEVVTEEVTEEAESESVTPKVGEAKSVTDDLGYDVILPEEINRIVIADLPPLVHAYYMVNGSVDGLVGAPENNALVDTMLPVVYPEVKELETGFRAGGELNMEELLALEPDVIFYRSDNEKTGELIRGTGVPAVAFQTFNNDNGNTVSAVEGWLKMLGEILGKEENTQEVIDMAYQRIGFIQSRMWDIPEDEKVKMLYLTSTSKEQIKVSGEGLFGLFWATIAGAEDMSEGDLKGAKVISMEQLYTYNPEVIFMVFSSLTPEDMYNDPNFAEIEAVKNHRVYQAPLGIFTWYGPSTDVPLSFLWHAIMLYPEVFEDVDLVEMAKEHYTEHYDYILTDQDIEFMFGDSLEVLNGSGK